MYTISRAAEQVGISTATLRAWEQRYAVVAPQRTDGAYRVYSVKDVQVLQAMKKLVDDGWSARFAAQEVHRLATEGLNADLSTETPVAPDVLSEQFVAAAASLDTAQLDNVLDQIFALRSFEAAVTDYLFPALRALGDGWASGQVSVAGEHLASHAVSRRLAAAYDAAGSTGYGHRVVLGLAPGCRHELGLLAFAVAVRRIGLRTDYLGADVPVADWLTACSEPNVAAIVISVCSDPDVASAAEVVAALGRHRPDVLIATGGANQAKAPEEAVRLGDDFAAGAQILARAVGNHSARMPSRSHHG